ncbi:MAG TPA: DNA-processing protein DprA [Steroidobacteraceae bacterium]|nr:DNA-processing protein DprA [Steroidobacteraceae bacterium]
MEDLFGGCARTLAPLRAIEPARELGAYEALWLPERASFPRLARVFRERRGALPSDLVPRAHAERCRRSALALVRAAGLASVELTVHGMPDYPARLREARDPVELIYFQGRWRLLERRCIAIVGTRAASREGLECAARFARHFARAGFSVLSGLAAGIDTAAHEAAIAAGGSTAAVLGTPLTACYPAANAGLQRRLARDFLVLTQVPIVRYARGSALANRAFFAARNATLAALAAATVIVEADERSGALIAARHALESGRKVFVLERCCARSDLEWPRRLLARGAIRVRDPQEIDERLAA